MPIKKPGQIVDPDTIQVCLQQTLEACDFDVNEQNVRAAILPLLTETLANGEAEVRRRFEASPTSVNAIRERTWLIDKLLQVIDGIAAQALAADEFAIVAVGGYGRRELFFHSDLDIMFLVGEKHRKVAEERASFILYLLWDLGLKIGQSVRTIDEALKEAAGDITIRTNLLEARFVSGQKGLAQTFNRRFTDEIVATSKHAFVRAKLDEWKVRHDKTGGSRYVLEPNIKEGKGGHRDLQTLMWMAHYCYGVTTMGGLHAMNKLTDAELKDFRRARQFLRVVRLHLHAFAGRAEERLSFDAQRAIAEKLGYTRHGGTSAVERFMKRYFLTAKTVGQLTRTICHILEAEQLRAPKRLLFNFLRTQSVPDGFRIDHDRLQFTDDSVPEQQPIKMVELFWLTHDTGIDIHPRAWQLVTRHVHKISRAVRADGQANALFLQLLTDRRNPEVALRKMNESGVLGKFIPDFGRVVGQMQFDLYHTYTVDEHTIFALGILHRIEAGEFAELFPLATALMKKLHMRRVLFMALLCHDIAKGRGGNHSELGAVVAMEMGRRFGFDQVECDTAAWLVRQHLLMTLTAFKRDLDDPQTIEKFVAEVRSPERLRLLLVLTVADIHAVGPTIWNGWKGQLLRSLYRKAERLMGEGEASSVPPREMIDAELATALPKISAEDRLAYIEGSETAFLEARGMDSHKRFLPLWLAVRHGVPFSMGFHSDPFLSITQVEVVAEDQPGFFAKMAGVLAVCGANIAHARIFTRTDGLVIDRFGVQDLQHRPFDEKRRQERIRDRLAQALKGELDIDQALRQAKRHLPQLADTFDMPPKVFIDNVASGNHTVIEVQCLDELGLLYRIARTLSAQGLNIATAHVATFGEMAVDVFYVKDAAGMKLHSEKKRQMVVDALLEELKPVTTAGRKRA